MKARLLAFSRYHANVVLPQVYLFAVICGIAIVILVRDTAPIKPGLLNAPTDASQNVLAGQGLDDYYIFVQGCVEIPFAPPSCQNDPPLDWHNWLEFLRDHYGFGPAHQAEFDVWRKTHV